MRFVYIYILIFPCIYVCVYIHYLHGFKSVATLKTLFSYKTVLQFAHLSPTRTVEMKNFEEYKEMAKRRR